MLANSRAYELMSLLVSKPPSVPASKPANLSAIRESCPGIDKDLDYDEFCQVLSELLVSEKKGDEG